MISTNGGTIFEGSFVNGELHGFGREIWRDYYYIGEFKDGRMHGQGTFAYSDQVAKEITERISSVQADCTNTNLLATSTPILARVSGFVAFSVSI